MLETDVLVVGAGPVGLALAGDLGWRGQKCLVIEQGDGSIYQPKMDLVGIRTMEFCRRWGIVHDVENAPYPRDYPQDNVYLTGFNGYELGRERMPAMGAQRPPLVSPQKRERCPQNMFDPILRKFALSHPTVEIMYHRRLIGFGQDDNGVHAQVADTVSGTTQQVLAKYIVGCDGARSKVRGTLGIEMEGNAALTYTTNAIFRCDDLDSLHDKHPAYRHIFIGPEGTWATIVAINGRDQWRLSIVGDHEPRQYSFEEISDIIVRLVGKPFPFEILTVVPWTRAELVATHYRKARAFIAGDAAHLMSPTGGFNMNTGIADAVDLSWKLQAQLEGWGGERMLTSYETERRPVAIRNSKEASANLARMMSPGRNPQILCSLAEGIAVRREIGKRFSEAMRREWYTLHIHLGACYFDSPICAYDPGDPSDYEQSDPPTYSQTTSPGARAPHAWLEDGRSTLDLFGREFVLMITGEDRDFRGFKQAASELGVPFKAIAIQQAEIRLLYEKPFVLVRPDGYVAWRGDEIPADPEGVLRHVTGV